MLGTLLTLGLIAALTVAVVACVWLLWQRSHLAAEAARCVSETLQARAALDRCEAERQSAAAQVQSLTAGLAESRERVAALRATLESLQRSHQERLRAYEEAQQQARQATADTFKALSADTLKLTADELLKRAQETFQATQVRAGEDFEQRRKAIDEMVKPVRESLDKYQKTLAEIEKERAAAHARIFEQVETIRAASDGLRKETGLLVQALKGTQTRAQWGENLLRRAVEMAGMTEHVCFSVQVTVAAEDGSNQRPDMVIRLPEGRQIVVDSKAVCDAYFEALQCAGEEQRRACLERHAKNVRQQIQSLGSKAYWKQFENTVEFVVMFLPAEALLSEAVLVDPRLFDDAVQSRVILATPMTLIALLWTIAEGWQQERLAKNAREIMEVGREMHARLAVLSGHAAKVGKNLDEAVEAYNKFVGSFERNALSQARKFEALNLKSGSELFDVEPVDSVARPFKTLPPSATLAVSVTPDAIASTAAAAAATDATSPSIAALDGTPPPHAHPHRGLVVRRLDDPSPIPTAAAVIEDK